MTEEKPHPPHWLETKKPTSCSTQENQNPKTEDKDKETLSYQLKRRKICHRRGKKVFWKKGQPISFHLGGRRQKRGGKEMKQAREKNIGNQKVNRR